MSENPIDPSSNENRPPSRPKRLGGYLVDAGLLTPAQVDVVLNDQKVTGMRFGEILAARGWVKQQTIEYLMEKVILPEQEAAKRLVENRDDEDLLNDKQVEDSASSYNYQADERALPDRHELPITKPLPSVPSSGDDVSWVG